MQVMLLVVGLARPGLQKQAIHTSRSDARVISWFVNLSSCDPEAEKHQIEASWNVLGIVGAALRPAGQEPTTRLDVTMQDMANSSQ